MKNILITGASGFLGAHLVNELLKSPEIKVIAICGRPEDKANALPEGDNIEIYPIDALFSESFKEVDTVVNCAFARSGDSGLLSAAVDFTTKEIKRFEDIGVSSVINISTQGVYKRLSSGCFANEDSAIEPIDLYSMTKYCVEKIFETSSIPLVTNVRLASLMMPQRFLYFFVKKAKLGESFTVTAPNQYASLIDVLDAALGLKRLVELEPSLRKRIYNLGIREQYSVLEYANSVKKIGRKFGIKVEFEITDNEKSDCAGMDCSRMFHDTGWMANISKDEMIENLFKEKMGENGY